MPAYRTSDAREFGNKQGTFPSPLERKKEKSNKENWRRAATGIAWGSPAVGL
jgi:hypothetical protein